MKKTEAELTNLFESKISSLFDEYKKMPHYGQESPTFLARPRLCDTFEKIKKILSELTDFTVLSIETHGNVHVIRLEDNLKISIIYAKTKEEFDWLYEYHSYSSSIILGRILKSAGLKYSEDGLEYLQYNLIQNHHSVVGKLVLTKNFEKILNIFGLNYEVFKKGFTSFDALLDFITSTKFFNPSKFVNYEKEHRAITLQKLEEYLILRKRDKEEGDKLTFEYVQTFFPEIDFNKEIAKLLEKAQAKKNINDKFNGRIILDTISGFDPKEVGLSMSKFKNSFSSVEIYKEFLSENSSVEIMNKFKEVNQIV
jgi:hypothetical protein